METIVCPFIRNVFDSALKGKFDYIDGMVLPHQCDSTDKTNNEWYYTLKLPYWHFLNVPHVTDDPSVEFFKSVLGVFIGSLERFTGQKDHERRPRRCDQGAQRQQARNEGALCPA